jgi:hypothetical protein
MTRPVTAPAMQQRVAAAIADASARTGVAFDYLMDQAQLESGMRPDARARTSSAAGLYQFTNQTWLATVKRHGPAHGLDWAAGEISQNRDGGFSVADPGMRSRILDLRTHPETAAVMAAEFASDNGAYLEARTNGNPEAVDLYQADPNQAASPLFPAAAAANQTIFYRPDGSARSLNEIRNGFAAKLAGATPGLNQMPVSTQQRFAMETQKRAPMALAQMQKMPQGLDLEFARNAYQRLSGLSA